MRALLILFVLLIPEIIIAQDFSSSDNKMDSASYAMYLNRDWKGLKSIDMEYKSVQKPYYTKYRIALANYYSGRLLVATSQFMELYNRNRLDSNLLKSTYFSLQESGFEAQAEVVKKNSLPRFKRILPMSILKPVREFSMGFGISTAKQNSAFTNGLDGTNTFQESDLMKGSNYGFFNFDGQITPRLSYSFNYSTITLNRTSTYDYQTYDSVGHQVDATGYLLGFPIAYDSTIYSNVNHQASRNKLVWQNQIYLGLNYKLGFRSEISAFGLVGNYRYQKINSDINYEKYQAQPYHTIANYKAAYPFKETLENMQFWLSGLEYSFNNNQLNVKNSLGVSRGYLNGKFVTQAQYALGWYPLNNYSLFVRGQVTMIKTDSSSSNLVYSLLVGKSLTNKFYININGMFGNFKNVHADQGRILLNYPDDGNYRLAGTLGYLINSKFRTEFTFSYTSMKSTRINYSFEQKGYYIDSYNFQLFYPLLTLTYQL
jgi:hypothetical protein